KSEKLKANEHLTMLIKDEVNIKEVSFDDSIQNDVELDTTITPELKAEGDAREFIRSVQAMRKKADLQPDDRIVLTIQTSKEGEVFLRQFQDEIQKTAGATEIVFGDATGEVVKAGGHSFTVSLRTV
ncbi:DUF5915 domain-containing protein, partial [Candidatus Pacebacteria bacterium]|nr:DUF5915 domain-containing protein [Candidatus Paceibacterota bacterium]